ncbi:hypothetical protein DM02DRAFT_614856, partial [Periconia macrospinosa]
MPTSPSESRVSTFGRSQVHGGSDLSSYLASKTTVQHSSIGYQDATQSLPNNDSAMQTQTSIQQRMAQAFTSLNSSVKTFHSHESELREITPWIDYDPQFALPLSDPSPPVRRITRDRAQQPGEESSRTGLSSIRALTLVRRDKKKDHKIHKNLPESSFANDSSTMNEARTLFAVHSRHPTTKHLDGAKDQVDGDYVFDSGKTLRRGNSSSPGFRSFGAQGQQVPELACDIFSMPDYSMRRSRTRRRNAISPIVSPANFYVSPTDTRKYINRDGTMGIQQREMGAEQPCEVLVNFHNPWPSSHSQKK